MDQFILKFPGMVLGGKGEGEGEVEEGSTCPKVNDDVDHEDSVAKAVEGDPSHA